MLRFRRQSAPSIEVSAPPSLPPGRRAYAIGDVHGRLDLLLQAISVVRADLAAAPIERAYVVFLLGNHEEAMLAAYDGDLAILQSWAGFGGAETAQSYGVPSLLVMRGDWPRCWQSIRIAVPVEHIEFMRSFQDQFTLGDYMFVHAGVRPGVPLKRQDPRDLRWIREEFLQSDEVFGKVVIHGHTISDEPEFCSNRIGIDTGAYRTGRLTVLRLEGDTQRVLNGGQARGSASASVAVSSPAA